MSPQLAWIGLGNMGRGMCKNLIEKGKLSHPLIIYNRTAARSEALANQLGRSKTKVAKTVQEAVSAAEIIFTCVGDDAAIKEMIASALEVDVSGKLFVDCSTVHPETTNEIAAKISGNKAEFVACPGNCFAWN
jgi:3-hydroxyisobutyrate dehydrogenase-like beta-hydroxyacid dehydrogenase